MRPTRRRCTVVLIVLGGLWVFIGEVGVHYIYSLQWQWPQLKLPGENLDKDFILRDPPGVSPGLLAAHRRHYQSGDTHYYTTPGKRIDSKTELRILFLSDPHIMCTYAMDDMWLIRRDSDGYVSTVFSHLMSTLHPDMVVLVGDSFYDAIHISDTQWKEDYLKCLKTILPVPAGVDVVISFGDNDIGGEGNDYMTEQATKRFVEAFGPLNNVFSIHGFRFIKFTTVCYINEVPKSQDEKNCRRELELFIAKNKANFQNSKTSSVLISHVPLHHNYRDRFHHLKEMVLTIEPTYIFSGHIHHESYSSHVIWEEGERDKFVKRLAHEITVPTCSYRNGEQYMGAGVAILSTDGDLVYRVLWLPQRYPFLASYAILFVLLVSTLCFCIFIR